MILEIITLRQVFSNIFLSRNSIDYNSLLSMIAVNDTLSGDIYSYDDSIASENTAKDKYVNSSGNFTLYNRVVCMAGEVADGNAEMFGNVKYVPIDNPDQLFNSSSELYLKSTSGTGETAYVSLYNLVHLDLSKIGQSTANVANVFQDTGIRIAAMVYSMACLERRTLMLHIGDMEASVAEQKLMNRVMAQLQQMSNDLIAMDGQESSKSTVTILPEILAFFAQRKLVDDSAAFGSISKSTIDSLTTILQGRLDANQTQRQISAIDSFQSWTQLHALMTHGDFFLEGTTVTANEETRTDLYEKLLELLGGENVAWKDTAFYTNSVATAIASLLESEVTAAVDEDGSPIKKMLSEAMEAFVGEQVRSAIAKATDLSWFSEEKSDTADPNATPNPIKTFTATISAAIPANGEWDSFESTLEAALDTLKTDIVSFMQALKKTDTEEKLFPDFSLPSDFTETVLQNFREILITDFARSFTDWRKIPEDAEELNQLKEMIKTSESPPLGDAAVQAILDDMDVDKNLPSTLSLADSIEKIEARYIEILGTIVENSFNETMAFTTWSSFGSFWSSLEKDLNEDEPGQKSELESKALGTHVMEVLMESMQAKLPADTDGRVKNAITDTINSCLATVKNSKDYNSWLESDAKAYLYPPVIEALKKHNFTIPAGKSINDTFWATAEGMAIRSGLTTAVSGALAENGIPDSDDALTGKIVDKITEALKGANNPVATEEQITTVDGEEVTKSVAIPVNVNLFNAWPSGTESSWSKLESELEGIFKIESALISETNLELKKWYNYRLGYYVTNTIGADWWLGKYASNAIAEDLSEFFGSVPADKADSSSSQKITDGAEDALFTAIKTMIAKSDSAVQNAVREEFKPYEIFSIVSGQSEKSAESFAWQEVGITTKKSVKNIAGDSVRDALVDARYAMAMGTNNALAKTMAENLAGEMLGKILEECTTNWMETTMGTTLTPPFGDASLASLKTSWETAMKNAINSTALAALDVETAYDTLQSKLENCIRSTAPQGTATPACEGLVTALEELHIYPVPSQTPNVQMADALSGYLARLEAANEGKKTITGVAGAVTDIYDAMYWVPASEIKDIAFAGIMGIEDHWVFDPRQRNSAGQILNKSGAVWDGSSLTDCAYFPGFATVTLKADNLPENSVIYVDPLDTQKTSETPSSLTFPDYGVRWFGSTPPTSKDDYAAGVAAMLRKTYVGGRRFLPANCFNADGSLSEKFLAAVGTGASSSLSVTLRWIGNGAFYVSSFGGESNGTLGSAVTGETDSASMTAYNLGPGATSKTDFWPIPKSGSGTGGGEVETLITPINTLAKKIPLNQTQLSAWKDTLRIYVEQITSDTSWRSAAISQSMQKTQEAVSVASNLLGAVEKLKSDAVANIR
ncbi:MAG: hypothetical protein LBT98_04445 [Puniceicoccales bacterium]|jgi:hypothetical protein|nr:hypothetical protein [Puniceicoccales bacterium]